MATSNQDVLARAYAMLVSLQKNINQMKDDPTEIFVQEFHTVLDRLGGIEIDVAEFRIPDSEVQPKIDRPITRTANRGDIIHYSKEKYVERSFILLKLDSILGYLEIITSEKPPKMGYSTPDNQ